MEPQIRYATTSDSVRIAYYAIGSGDPLLVFPPLGPSHLALERRLSGLADWYEHIAASRTLIRFDFRNMGMSDRKVDDMSPEAYDRDVAAVLEQLRIDSVDVLAVGPSTLSAMAFAARESRARKLALVNPNLRWMDYYPGPQGKAILALAETDWDLFVETASHARLGWSRQESHDFAVLWKESMLQSDYARFMAAWRDWDVSPQLAQIRAETLVLYGSVGPWPRSHLKAAREIASSVSSAHVVECDDAGEGWLASRKMRQEIDEFFGIASEGTAGAAVSPSGTAVILFADIVDSTALTERLGDAAFREHARKLDEAMRAAIKRANGTAIEGKLLGDGVLAVFTAARDAITAALACRDSSRDVGLELHFGIHAGDVIREANNVFGGAVNIASRISGLSAPGEVLVSQTIRDLARTSAGVSFEDRGEQSLKGVGEPVRVFAVRHA